MTRFYGTICVFVAICALAPVASAEQPTFLAATYLQAGGSVIDVGSYSTPTMFDWNGDGANDLLIGTGDGQVRFFENLGTTLAPSYDAGQNLYAGGSLIDVPSTGCGTAFVRVTDWNNDGDSDLLIGDGDGYAHLFLSDGWSGGLPALQTGSLLETGPAGSKEAIRVNNRATVDVIDWNDDGKKDVMMGSGDGMIYLLVNAGTDAVPDFTTPIGPTYLQWENLPQAEHAGGSPVDAGFRSAPDWVDLDGDGLEDIVCGDWNGNLSFFENIGTSGSPLFAAAEILLADGVVIDEGARSRPEVLDYNGDGVLDMLVGGSEGNVALYQGVPEPASLALLAIGSVALVRRRRR